MDKEESDTLKKCISILSKINFTVAERWWLKKNKPYIYDLKYNLFDISTNQDNVLTYSLCSQDVAEYINTYGDLYPCYKHKELNGLQLWIKQHFAI